MIMLFKNAQDFGKLVRDARKSNDITQKQVAGACGTGIRFIRELEKGKPTCELDKALLVAGMLGIKLNATLPATVKE
jgi:HTH-type transcriptional regulator / antitoxin HipB